MVRITAYDKPNALPGQGVAPSSAILGDAVSPLDTDTVDCPEDSVLAAPAGEWLVCISAYDEPIALPGQGVASSSAILGKDNTFHGPSGTNGIVLLIPSRKTYIWFWLFVIGQILLAIFVALAFHLSQSNHSIISYIDMLFIFILVYVAALFLYFALAQYLKNKFPNPRVDSIVNVTIVIMYYAIIIVSSELGKFDLSLYVHVVVSICSSTFMALLTYTFDEDVGKVRTKITLQTLACMLYYFQEHEKIYVLLYLVPSAVGYLTLIIGGDGPVESINVAFLRIISLTPKVQPNYENSHLRSVP